MGCPRQHMRRACEWLCYARTADPQSASLVPDDAPALDENVDGNDDVTVDEPGYGGIVAWNETHTPSRYINATD